VAMTIVICVYARTRFVAFHQWKDAPEDAKYLQSSHRHEFHVEAAVLVTKSDREVEFHHLKRDLDLAIKEEYRSNSVDKPIEASCERIAMTIATMLRENDYDVKYVDVSEDGECGGRVEYN